MRAPIIRQELKTGTSFLAYTADSQSRGVIWSEASLQETAMAQQAKPPYRPADVTYLLQELRRLSAQRDGSVAFWKVMRWHLRDRRDR